MKTEDFTRLIHHKTEYFGIREFYSGNKEGLPKTEKFNNLMTTEYTAGTDGSWFVSLSTRTGSCFSVYKEYRSTGIIKCKWVTFRNGGAVVGIRYTYDPNGKLISAEDEEEGFPFTPHQVLKFCEENGIDLFSDDTCIERFIERREQTYYYIIRYKGEYKGNSGITIMLLNGKDGIPERVILHSGGTPGAIIYEREKQP